MQPRVAHEGPRDANPRGAQCRAETPFVVEWLDGSSPLDFLAALGLLRILAERNGAVQLRWVFHGSWRPEYFASTSFTLSGLADTIAADAQAWLGEPLLHFAYPKREKRGVKPFKALKPPVPVLRAWLRCEMNAARWQSVDYVAALMCEGAAEPIPEGKVLDPSTCQLTDMEVEARDLSMAARQTALDFTCRNVQFLDQIHHIAGAVEAPSAERELRTGRGTIVNVRRMDWDPLQNAPAATYTRSLPARPVAEWLAFRGLVFLPVTPASDGPRTTGCTGRRLKGHFTWPIWNVRLRSDTIASLMGRPDTADMPAAERTRVGIAAVYRSRLGKAATGYDGRFEPSEVL